MASNGVGEMICEIGDTSSKYLQQLKKIYDAKINPKAYEHFGFVLAICLIEKYDITRLKPIYNDKTRDLDATDKKIHNIYKIATALFETPLSENYKKLWDEITKSIEEIDLSRRLIVESNKDVISNLLTPIRAFNTFSDRTNFDIYNSNNTLNDKEDKKSNKDNSRSNISDHNKGADGAITFHNIKIFADDKTSYIPIVKKYATESGYANRYTMPNNLGWIFRTFTDKKFQSILSSYHNFDSATEKKDYNLSIICKNMRIICNILTTNVAKLDISTLLEYSNQLEILRTRERRDNNHSKIPIVDTGVIISKLQEFDNFETTLQISHRRLITEYIIGKYCLNSAYNSNKYFPIMYGIDWISKSENDREILNMRNICEEIDKITSKTKTTSSTRSVVNLDQIEQSLNPIKHDGVKAYKKNPFNISYQDVELMDTRNISGTCEFNNINRDEAPIIVMSNIDKPIENNSEIVSNTLHILLKSFTSTKKVKKTNHGKMIRRATCLLMDCITQICDALIIPQRRFKFVHCDLHPSNIKIIEFSDRYANTIIFDKNLKYFSKRSVKIYDFGRSKATFGNIDVYSGNVHEDTRDNASPDIKYSYNGEDSYQKFFQTVLDSDTNTNQPMYLKNASLLSHTIQNHIKSENKRINQDDAHHMIVPRKNLSQTFVIENGNMRLSKEPEESNIIFSEYYDIYYLLSSIIFTLLKNMNDDSIFTSSGEDYNQDCAILDKKFKNITKTLTDDANWNDIASIPPTTLDNNTTSLACLKLCFQYIGLAISTSIDSESGSLNYKRSHYIRGITSWFNIVTGYSFKTLFNIKRFGICVMGNTKNKLTLSKILSMTMILRSNATFDQNNTGILEQIPTHEQDKNVPVHIFKDGCKFVGDSILSYINNYANQDICDTELQAKLEQTKLFKNDNNMTLFDKKLLIDTISIPDKDIRAHAESLAITTHVVDKPTTKMSDIRFYTHDRESTFGDLKKKLNSDGKTYLATVKDNLIAFTNHTLKQKPSSLKEPASTRSKGGEPKLVNITTRLNDYSNIMHETCYFLSKIGQKHITNLKQISETLELMKKTTQDLSGLKSSFVREFKIYDEITKFHLEYVKSAYHILSHITKEFTPDIIMYNTLNDKDFANQFFTSKNSYLIFNFTFYLVRYALSLHTLTLNVIIIAINEYAKIIQILSSLP